MAVRVTLQLSVGQSVRSSVLALSPSGTHDQILFVINTVVINVPLDYFYDNFLEQSALVDRSLIGLKLKEFWVLTWLW
jgi:hypothetical protein